jgi:hypothetical protein
VHERLFKQEKKLPTCTVGEEAGQMLFLQMSATNYAGAKSFTEFARMSNWVGFRNPCRVLSLARQPSVCFLS